jgi:hypothetical protein
MSEYAPGTFLFAEQIMDIKVQEARRYRRQSRAGRATDQRFYFGALAWLGQRLTAWGEDLQERYNAPAPRSIHRPASG